MKEKVELCIMGKKKGRHQVKKIHRKGSRFRMSLKKKAEAFSKLTPIKKVKEILQAGADRKSVV